MVQLFRKVRKVVLFYRFLRFRKGFGVHSPFAFGLITKVIDERCPYYCFDRIELLRRQLRQSDRSVPGRKEIKASHGQLIFRLTNYFKPRQLVQLGGDALSVLYTASYASDITCRVIEENPACREQIEWGIEQMKNRTVQVIAGTYGQKLPEMLQQVGKVDFVFFNYIQASGDPFSLFTQCLPFIHENTIFVIEGIRDNRRMKDCWKAVKSSEAVVLTFDLYNVGIVCFNKRLHRKDYMVYF